jgi:hypothetical protein
MSRTISPANREAIARILACVPVWSGVASARDALALPDRTLLHAGPPLADPTRPPPPMLNAAVLACLHEGWADGEAAAEALIAAGTVRLEPGLARRVSSPLVSLVGPRTTLVVLHDANAPARRWFGFLGSGGGAQMRFGARDRAILERLAFRERELAPGFAALLGAGPVDLLSIARSALTEGDDLHNRLSSATLVLQAVLASRKVDAAAAQAALATILEAPLYFLNLWMPACALMLDAAVGAAGATLVTRLAANGEVCGIQLAGMPERWFTAPAGLVRGPLMKGAPEHPQFPPATGDSGIIDAFGLGGQVLRRAPSLLTAFEPWLAEDDAARALGMLTAIHPVLGVAVGVDAAAVAAGGRGPLLSTGMVSADGRGLLGRGLCEMPVDLFRVACAALDA